MPTPVQVALVTLRDAERTKPRSKDYRGIRLLADGRKALQLLNSGRTIPEVRLVIAGSRARLYRALKLAHALEPGRRLHLFEEPKSIDPLLS